MTTREENIKKINAELELLSDEQLEEVAGGNSYDRGLLIDELKKNKLEKYLEPGKNNEEILVNTCKKYQIGYKPSSILLDKFEINGKWRDTKWIRDNQAEAIAFIKKKIGV